MALPFILAAISLVGALVGGKKAYDGYEKMSDADEKNDKVKKQQKKNKNRLEKSSTVAIEEMDKLGEKELKIFSSFDDFSDLVEKIHNKPSFAELEFDSLNIPNYSFSEIKQIGLGAEIALGGLKGAAAGAAGGFAAAGVTTVAVAALGTASTGTAIASLSGAAATNAILAALGGGSIAAGGGGVALGSLVLGASTLGIGLMIGGIIFEASGDSVLEDAKKAMQDVERETKKVDQICEHFDKLRDVAVKYYEMFVELEKHYCKSLTVLSYIVNDLKKTEYKDFTAEERTVFKNTTLCVSILYRMGKVKIVSQKNQDALGIIHSEEVNKTVQQAKDVLERMAP